VSLLYKTTVSSYGWRLQSLEIDYWFLVTYKGKGKLNMQVSYVDHTLVCRVMELFYWIRRFRDITNFLPAWSESVDYAGTPPYFPFKPKSNRQHAPAYPPRGKRHKREWLLPMNVWFRLRLWVTSLLLPLGYINGQGKRLDATSYVVPIVVVPPTLTTSFICSLINQHGWVAPKSVFWLRWGGSYLLLPISYGSGPKVVQNKVVNKT